ncbi:MAG: penicillin-binding protein 1B [Acidiferrobacteraceae bacterium]
MSPKRLAYRVLGVAFLGIGLLLGGYAAYLNHVVRSQFEQKRWALPAKVYASPLELYPSLRISSRRFESTLLTLGYRESGSRQPGTFVRSGDGFSVVSRPFRFANDTQPALSFDARFSDRRLVSLTGAKNTPVALIRLDPEYIGALYPGHHEDRVLVKLQEVPPTLIKGLIAVEDRTFYSNIGVDPEAMVRASLADLRAGRVVEGASTLTQQLARNFYLTPARTLRRKVTEALMAMLLTWHYSKNDILDTYINEVYLGQNGDIAIHGFGLASWFYFNRPLDELDVSQQALLIGLVKGPSYYNPRRHGARAVHRRNVVLSEMVKQHVITQADASRAMAEPLGVTPKPPPARSPYPAFMDLVRRELPRDYRNQDLRTGGLRIFTTLNTHVQNVAQRALTQRLAAIERSRQLAPGTLEGAVVVTDPDNGEVSAVIGGRSARAQGFNRALHAARQTGSVIKPAIYLTALEQPSKYTLATLLDDTQFTLKEPNGTVWQPRNYDREYHGQVMLMTALAHSYNVATIRLGLALGLKSVIATAHTLGIREPIAPFPSSFLGASSITPWDMTHMYQTIAANGFRTPLRVIRSITTAHGRLLKRFPLHIKRVAAAAPVYLLIRALQAVVREGTGRGLAAYLPSGTHAAGKTGTTEDLRDSWFAGFTGNRLAIVWVGRDDDKPTGLTGASGAMTVWGTLMGALQPQPLNPAMPRDIERVWIDPVTGLRADRACPGAVRLPFIQGSAPTQKAPCAQGSLLNRLLAPLRRLIH